MSMDDGRMSPFEWRAISALVIFALITLFLVALAATWGYEQ